MVDARDIYPDAPADFQLLVDDTRMRSHANGRSWSRISAMLGAATAVAAYLPVESLAIPAAVLLCLTVASALIAVVDRRRRPRHRVTWGRWGRARGLVHVQRPPFAGSGLDVLEPQLERRWHGLHHGRIGRGDDTVEAWLGSTEWDSRDTRHWLMPDVVELALQLAGDNDIGGGMRSATIVAIDLGEDVGRWFPASSLVSFLEPADGIPTGWSNPKVLAKQERRLESIRLDETRAIRVRGSLTRWHDVFDAALVERLTTTPAQWIQRTRWLVLLDPSGGASRVDAVAIDTLASIAPDIARRFREVAAAAARDEARATG